MIVLCTNDDGYLAEGIKTLSLAFGQHHQVWTVAPDREQSACSHKLTLNRPLRLFQHADKNYSIDGTPTDCIYMAVHHLMPKAPDLIISGINRGPNMGDDVTYSGTIAAAMEGAVLGIPSIAVSAAGYENIHYDTAAQAALYLSSLVEKHGLPKSTLININTPADLPVDKIVYKLTRLGKRNYKQSVIERKDPRGKKYFWIGGNALGYEDIEGSDINAVESGFVSVSPLSIDLTNTTHLDSMAEWFTKS